LLGVSAFLLFSLLLLLPGGLALVGGCSDDGSRGTQDQPIDCGAIAVYPPNITVVDAVNGSPLCDPTFAVLTSNGEPLPPDDGGAYACAPDFGGCPPAPADGGAPPCTFMLSEVTWPGSYSVRVFAPGFAPVVVDDVSGGVGGCVAYVAPSVLTVTLSPSDAGDAG
jgi:hypothetical protein